MEDRDGEPAVTGNGVRIALFGPMRVVIGDQDLDPGPRRQKAVLAILALSAGRVVAVDRLTDDLWGDEPPAASRNALQVYVAALRRMLPDGARRLRTVDPGYVLDCAADAVDVLRFERLVDAAPAGRPALADLTEALDLWTAEPLADLADLPFAEPVVARLRELRLRALEDRIELDLEAGQPDAIAATIEALLVEDPYRERLWRQLMLARYRAGRQADALAAFRRARRVLRDDLGLEPGPALAALERAILVQDPALDPPAPTTQARPSVPLPLTPTVGRATDIEAVAAIVSNNRLVTILGPGGVGKTRLALEVARLAAQDFPDGALFVDLSAVRDGPAFVAELAQVVGAESAEDDLGAILAALAGRRMLLVLDNTEQLPNAGAVIGKLLAGTERLHILVTTRAALRTAAERVVPLAPLDRADAAALFVARATAASGTEPDPATALAIADRLDGLPLALELAAASCRVIEPAEVLRVLVDRLPLPSGPRDVPERQRTLRGAVEWSLGLLAEPERRLLAALAILRAPFTRDVPAALFPDAGELTGEDVASLLAHLVEASLVVHEQGRYRLLQPIRDAVADDLDGSAAGLLLDRHASWISRVAADGSVELYRGDEQATRARLLALLPDMRAGFDHLAAGGRFEAAARLVLDVAQVWFHAGRLHEAEARLGQVVGRPGLSPRTAAEALTLRGIFLRMTGDNDTALPWIVDGVDSLRSLAPDSIALVNGLCHLADLQVGRGENTVAAMLADEAVAAARRTTDDGTVSMALDLAGYIARAIGDRDRAIAAAREAVAEARGRDSFLLADALAGLAASLGPGDPDAPSIAWEAIERAESGGQPNQRGKVSITVAEVLGPVDPARMTALLADAVATYLAIGSTPSVLDSAIALAGLDRPGSADTARLLGAIRRRSGGSIPDDAKPVADRVRETIGPAEFDRASGAGAALDDDAVSRLAAVIAARVGAGGAVPPSG